MISTEHLDRLTASASAPVALAYGRHVVAGNLILRDDQTNQSVLFIALGEGEWDSAETVWFNGVVLDPSKYHFHPGKDDVRLPVDQGLASQVISTDGNNPAQLSWVGNGAGGCPAGSNQWIQYNSSGNCGASAKLTWNDTASVLSIGLTHTGNAPAIEHGTTSETRNSLIDFHSSGNVIDYDVRLLASGGSATIGQGIFQLHAETFQLGSDVDVTFLADGATNFGVTGIRAGTIFADDVNTETLKVTRPSHASHITQRWDGTTFQIENTGGTDMFTLNNGTSGAVFAGSVKSETFLIEEGAGFWEMSLDVSSNLEFYNGSSILMLRVDNDGDLRPTGSLLMGTNDSILPLGGGFVDIGSSGAWFDDFWVDDINLRANMLPLFSGVSD